LPAACSLKRSNPAIKCLSGITARRAFSTDFAPERLIGIEILAYAPPSR
jgi:hypothetical protein